MSRRRPEITAQELMAELKADPEWVAAREREARERQRRAAEWREAEAPLVEELSGAGFDVQSAWDLVNTSEPYPAALPILLRHLERPYPDRVREGIARALAVRDAKFAWGTLKALYEREKAGSDAKGGLAVALAAASDDDVIDDVIALARDARHGDSRLLLLRALERSQNPRVPKALEELAADAALREEIRAIRSRRR